MELNPLISKLTQAVGLKTCITITTLYDMGIITDFTEDGWVLNNREWYPINTFLERNNQIEHL
jgi:hypothetical protein